MSSMKYALFCGLIWSISVSHAVTIEDVQKLNVTNFFGEWSKFLDQVLQTQQEEVSPENNQIYQAFIQQAKVLNIPKVTGNKKSIAGMNEQMKGIQKRMGSEKKVLQDWEQLSESLMNAAQPISSEQEKEYQALMRQAKDVGLEKSQLDAMQTKMSELRGKLGVAAPSQPEIPSPVMSPVIIPEKKEEKVNKEEIAVETTPMHIEEPASAHKVMPEEGKLEVESAS